ncbi:hypothetical protein FACS1894147_12290 [Spirochaetia bacterium]|nr:hypothetical protein FACS1894147_12290 [Spirochaetia bacterium]
MREKDAALSQKPQLSLSRSTPGRMWLISVCAFLVIIQSSVGDSFSSLGIALVTVLSAALTEAMLYYRSRRPIPLKDGSAVASALILAILLPNHIPPLYAAAGAAFAVGIIKFSFGGLGSNWLNPAAGAWLLIRFSWPETFRTALGNSPLILSPDNPAMAFSYSTDTISAVDSMVRSFLNGSIFSLTRAELPGGYIDLLMSPTGGIIADRGVGLLLLGTVIISATQINRVLAPCLYLGVYALLVRLFGALPFGGDLGQGDILFGLFSGGTLAAAFLLTSDPATGAKSTIGFLSATAAAAILGFVFRYFGAEPYGVILGVLLINTLVPLIRDIESGRLYEKQRAP